MRDNKHKDRIIVPIDYNPHMAKPGDVLRKHYNAMIRKNENLKEVFPAPPYACTKATPKFKNNFVWV